MVQRRQGDQGGRHIRPDGQRQRGLPGRVHVRGDQRHGYRDVLFQDTSDTRVDGRQVRRGKVKRKKEKRSSRDGNVRFERTARVESLVFFLCPGHDSTSRNEQ